MSDNSTSDVAQTVSKETDEAINDNQTTNAIANEEVNDKPAGVIEEEAPIAVNDLGMSFAEAIESTIVEFDDGDLITGTVVKIDKDEVLVDIGFKSEGVIPIKELSIRADVNPSEIVTLGEEIEVLVLTKEDKDGRLILSKKRAQYEKAWANIEAIKNADGVVKGIAIEVVKGGVIVDIGLRGFLPASLVDTRRIRDLASLVGTEIECKILELDRQRNNVVLSRRAFLEENQKGSRDDFLSTLQVGEIKEGHISSLVPFGAFVDLGGMDGLIHVSELSWKHIDSPGQVVKVGDPVKVKVLEIDNDRERISLSLKATERDPWTEFAETHQLGELVYGKVSKVVPFGSFIQIWFKIIEIDNERRRISLSIKQAAEGGVVAAEYADVYGEHAYDDDGNFIGAEEGTEETVEGDATTQASSEIPAE